MQRLYNQWNLSEEKKLLAEVSEEVPWGLVEHFSTLVRESGTEGERKAAQYIVDKLRSWGVEVNLYEPELLISLPRRARLEIISPENGRQLRCKTPAFSLSTDGRGVEGEVVYVTARQVEKIEEIFESKVQAREVEVKGRIVLTEGLSMPMKVRDYEKRGAIAQIYINPGTAIHEGICTSIWGTPTPANLNDKPSTPIICVNQPDGERLIEMWRGGDLKVRVETHLDEGWVKCPLPVASVRGSLEPEKFMLVHGHLDSWHVGIGDNATGDAALLEIARVFHRHGDKLKRSLRVAWWPGHSHGRYAGSTWYADNFALDLDRNCIAQIDIDSPGCRWATEYSEDVMWMREADEFCRRVIRDVTGKESRGKRPLRAGDYSFNQIGLSGFYMLLSNIPPEVRREKGFNYIVGGCGGNTAWHTEDDTIEVGDPEVLYTDVKIYVASIYRVLNSIIYPFNYVSAVDEILEHLHEYQQACDGHFDLGPAISAADELRSELAKFYERVEEVLAMRSSASREKAARRINRAMMELARVLVPINYARGERFDHDPAISLPPLPRIEPVKQLPELAGDKSRYRFLQTQMIRERNKATHALLAARRIAESIAAD